MSKTPHKCPVCQGSGQVPLGFYGHNLGTITTTTTIPLQTHDICRSCQGTGIVWDHSDALEKIKEILDKVNEVSKKVKDPVPEWPWPDYVDPNKTWDQSNPPCLIPPNHEGPIFISCPCRRCTPWFLSI